MIIALCGMTQEASVLQERADAPLVYCGEQAAATFGKFSNLGNVNGLLSFGVCGGLDPTFKVGDLILANSVTSAQGTYIADPAWNRRVMTMLRGNKAWPRVFLAPCYSDPNRWITTPAARAQFYSKTGCEFCDTESYAVAQIGAMRGIPFITIRAVSDDASSIVVDDPNEMNPDGTVDIWRGISDFFDDPADTIASARGFSTALETLRAAVSVLSPTYCR